LDGGDYVTQLGQRLAILQEAARKHQEQVVRRRLDKANSHVQQTSFSLGELVLVEPATKPRKLSTALRGPYKIISLDASKHTYQVQHIVDTDETEYVHHDRLRKLVHSATPQELVAAAALDDGEFPVDRVKDHRYAESLETIEFLTSFTGYGEDADEWLQLPNIEGNAQLKQYIHEHSELHALFSGRPGFGLRKPKSGKKHKSQQRKLH